MAASATTAAPRRARTGLSAPGSPRRRARASASSRIPRSSTCDTSTYCRYRPGTIASTTRPGCRTRVTNCVPNSFLNRQPLFKPIPGTPEQVELVGAFLDRMALARIDHVLVRHIKPAQRPVKEFGLARRHVRIVLAVQDQQRRVHLRCERDRADPVVPMRPDPLPTGASAETRLV